MKALTAATAELLKPVELDKYDTLEVDINKELTYFQIKVRTTRPGGGSPSLNATRTWIQRLPERKELTGFHHMWEIAATDVTCEIMRAVWGDRPTFESDAKRVYDYLLLTSEQLDLNADSAARFRELGELPALVSDLDVHPELPLGRHQQVGAAISMKSEGYGLFFEQGAGKTPVVISTICTEAGKLFAQEKRMYRAIVVAPNNVRMNWQSEISRFTTRGGKVTVMRGGEVNRVKLLIDALTPEDGCEFTVIVMSYETLVRMWDTIESISWDLACLDEGHFIKWPETKRAKYAFKLRDNSKRRVILTGTPVCNTPLDLYSLFEFMGKGWSGFHSWKAFRTFYGVFADVEGEDAAYKKLVGVQNLAFMKERLAKLSMIVKKKEVLPDLPDKVYDIIECEMTTKQRDTYEQVAQQLALEIENELDNSKNEALTINNVLTKLLRLAQITSGFVTYDKKVDEESKTYKKPTIEFFEVIPKLDQLVKHIKGDEELGYPGLNADEKAIIWACWVPDIQKIKERLDAEGIKCVTYYGGTSEKDRELNEAAFNNDPSVKVWISNPAAGGTGLNLLGYDKTQPDGYTTNVTDVYYYSQGWSGPQRWQSEDRAHRRGTRVQVRYHDLCVPETIDEEIRTRVLQKQKTALEVSDIREILRSVLEGLKA